MRLAVHILVGVMLAASVASTGCDARDSGRAPAQTESADARDTAAATTEAATDRKFVPPADGNLTREQIQRYLAIRRKSLEIARQTEAARDPLRLVAETVAAEPSAARQLGYDLNEYRWIQGRITDASGRSVSPDPSRERNRALIETFRSELDALARDQRLPGN